ncbi:5-methyltetrahydropteroyltriglutamate--homocysteine S-methyltransferase [Loigolactobacillus backii]|uniref:5-methyltetrahydropteroyltriglutamate-- homocysteine S-methyltransferase n=1 Tax=Loigolactobacillus backii TaxID=375175 RepID=UPI0007F067FC|nr:5-methyltetrahydropteroyltriglutamate--homocysteine S-methyltransferase [Loigolactobacillus backii]ANK65728.1 5-methyltetrahydropteroyltriglutamate--homocysteine S-methyltransferase [Loigolactobacillus backii]ANK68204.1 5-methyltetrahydropteroyltriglutamate--homocysteine S-methyltransferase [Loigolactobacillus backii]MDA5387702.1 5-methyltetrahydropteroyltriglutamate--homocysteine S-methyltransferase [Loigolactobacillus backii]MDA5390230.1 5-methyltetrahydropteroyltriglutamate--homocysteine 
MVKSSNAGYPRIGEKREWKFLLEHLWANKIDETEFLEGTKALRLANLKKQQTAGVDLIPVADYSNYDHVLDTAAAFGVVPQRFGTFTSKLSLSDYYNIARGTKDAVAAEMTKWFNTNYHYIVPELDHVHFQLLDNRWLTYYKEAKAELGIDGKPVILGPVSFLKLSKVNDEYVRGELLDQLLAELLPLYVQIFKELATAGVKWVQLDEPTLATLADKKEIQLYKKVLEALHEAAPEVKILVQTYFAAVDYYQDIVNLPAAGFGLDFVHDHGENLKALQTNGFPEGKVLAAGIVDGRNIWRSDLAKKQELVAKIEQAVKSDQLWLQASNSLLHVPITVKNEAKLDPVIKGGLAFADEKIAEIVTLTKGANGVDITAELADSKNALDRLNQSEHRNNAKVKEAVQTILASKTERHSTYPQRVKAQSVLNLPVLPTTTIGSFPQSPEVRSQRKAWRKGDLSNEAYQEFLDKETKRWIKIQEDLDIDVLVHGEFERTDMVEYFGQKLKGFTTTQNGWVQSYGSRCVKPPLVFGDVQWTKPITVRDTVFAQKQTDRLVKGMLTSAVTVINWSFVRDDLPKNLVADQIGLALRHEVKALEDAGIKIIQVDEPALREGLPLKPRYRQEYLDNAVKAFKITTTGVKDETQIHTHMCYSDFEDILPAISALDADVISIESSRSKGESIKAFEQTKYDKQIGLGVYDIHSPRIPSVEEIEQNINRALKVIDVHQFWINPDCGLKTRKEAETIPALKNMVQARNNVRAKLGVKE